MKSINLLSLINVSNDVESSMFELYKNNLGITIKEKELTTLNCLINEMKKYSKEINILNDFYFGYTIGQISKEFDLLRFGQNNIINIELKSENVGEKIKRQLIQNKYYLSFLGKEIFNFTYVAGNEDLLYLNENEELIKVKFSFLIDKLNEQNFIEIEDIDKLFNPTNYLVSPFNSTKAFLNGEYFLTGNQNDIKNKIINLNNDTNPCFISIQGAAGTGKTLLTYDIAKKYMNDSKKVVIFHCGALNDGHYMLRQKSWEIKCIKDFTYCDLTKYDLIIVDEVQRIRKPQLDSFLDKVKNTTSKCIFSYDPKQCLGSWEIKNNIPEYIKEQVSPHYYKLTEKIRTNKEIASFINNLFNKHKKNDNQVYSNVSIQYFSAVRNAVKYIKLLNDQGWKVIDYTPSKYKGYPYDDYSINTNDNAHTVIGQEYDNVVVVIDKYYDYNDRGELFTKGWRKDPYYHPTKMLFQIITRARKKLTVIIIDNEIVFNHCIKILYK